MFRKYFGIKENPFSNTPDPNYLFMSDRHQEALAHLQYGVQGSSGFVLLTGEVGTGKTTVCRCLVEQLPKNVNLAMCLNPRLNEAELLASICDELAIKVKKHAPDSVKGYMDALNKHLLKVHAKGGRAVLIIDEAQNLPPSLLELVRLLTNLETASTKLLQIILVGQPELRDTMDTYEMRQLSQRITARYHLDPMTRPETEDYIRHRLRIGKLSPSLIGPGAMAEIYARSAGIPRLINSICERSLLGAYATEASHIDAALARTAAREVLGDAPPALSPRPGAPAGRWAFAAVLAAAVLAGALTLDQRDREGAAAFAAPAPAHPPAQPITAKTMTAPAESSSVRPPPRTRPEKPVIVAVAAAQMETESEELKAVSRLVAAGAVTTAATQPEKPGPGAIESDTIKKGADASNNGATERATATPDPAEPEPETKPEPGPVPPAAAPAPGNGKLTLENLFRRPDIRGGLEAAMTRMFQLWSKDAKTLSGLDPCADAEVLGLKCFRQRGSWSNMEALNRPALISLVNAEGVRKYAVVSALMETRATLEIGNRKIIAEAGDIQSLWSGDFMVLWNPLPRLRRSLRPGMTGKDVAWLRERLGIILGVPTGGKKAASDIFDDGLKKRVIAFQESRKLETDGVVGTLTQIQLGAAIAPSNVPVLRTKP